MSFLNTTLSATLTAATLLMGTVAQADLQKPDGSSTLYYAQIDCYASDLDHTGTNSRVAVTFVSDDGDRAGTANQNVTNIEAETMKINPSFNPFSSALGTSASPLCNKFTDAVYFSDTFEPFGLGYLDISISGDDAFWMDEIRVYRRDFANDRFKDNLVGHWGRDNGNGWCLSTDANDINGSFKTRSAGSACMTKLRFQVEGEKVFSLR